MKQYTIALGLFFTALMLHAAGIREEMSSSLEPARVSHALGLTIGSDLRQAGLEIDYSAFLEGLKAGIEEDLSVQDRELALEIVQDAIENAMRLRADELRVLEIAFLTENAERAEIQVSESGIQYEVLRESEGAVPGLSDTVLVHYEGTLTDGTVFDSSYERGDPEAIPLTMVIPGWAEGLQLMTVGSKYRIYIPSTLAYGGRGAGQIIPPYSTLVFTIELFEIVDDTEAEAAEEAEITEEAAN